MNILDYLDETCVILELKAKSKKNAISLMLDHLISKAKLTKPDKKDIARLILQREEMGSTAIGKHIALPHARIPCVKNLIICIGISREGLDFDALDQEPVNIVAMLLSNQKEAGLHLKMLAFLAKMLRDKYLIQRLRAAKSEEEVLKLLDKQQYLVQQ